MSDRADRIDELEGKVRELEATVKGLTEELVDANERIRDLEARLDDGGTSQAELDQVVAGASADGRQGSDAGQGTGGQSARDVVADPPTDGQPAATGESPSANGTTDPADRGDDGAAAGGVQGADGIVDADGSPGADAAGNGAGRPIAERSQDSGDDDSDGDDIIVA